MRLWTLHPKYLDIKGLLAVWREGLLAQKVYRGKTNGYRNHPQLVRFGKTGAPVSAIGAYLMEICNEAAKRGYAFDRDKIASGKFPRRIRVTRGQLAFEWLHLLAKVRKRDAKKYRELLSEERPIPHPLFKIIDGEIEEWEGGAARRGIVRGTAIQWGGIFPRLRP